MSATQQSYSPSCPPQLGDKVIVVQQNNQVQVTDIVHRTKSGQFKLRGDDRRWKMAWNGSMQEFGTASHTSIWRRSSVYIYPHSSEKLAEVQAEVERRIKDDADERAEKRRRRDQREQERQQQIAHMRLLVPDIDGIEASTQSPLPDGTRVYQHTFLSRPYTTKDDSGQPITADRGWVWVIITCKDVEDCDWQQQRKVPKVQLGMSYRTARSSSFSSVSTSEHDTEEDAVYEGLRFAYHEGW